MLKRDKKKKWLSVLHLLLSSAVSYCRDSAIGGGSSHDVSLMCGRRHVYFILMKFLLRTFHETARRILIQQDV